MPPRMLFFLAISSFWLSPSLSSQDSADRASQPAPKSQQPPEPRDKRLFGIIPNYKTFPMMAQYEPLSPREKFKIASQDAFDRGTFALAAAFAGKSQLADSDPSFGQGVEGYAHRFATSYGDWAIGDFMTEAVFPSMLHQDPRYFRKGDGSGISRLFYAMGLIFWTRTDGGGHMFNFSEIGGNAAASAISQAYYPDERNAGSAAETLGIQVGVDMASNVMKEFYPDMRRWLHRKHASAATGHP